MRRFTIFLVTFKLLFALTGCGGMEICAPGYLTPTPTVDPIVVMDTDQVAEGQAPVFYQADQPVQSVVTDEVWDTIKTEMGRVQMADVVACADRCGAEECPLDLDDACYLNLVSDILDQMDAEHCTVDLDGSCHQDLEAGVLDYMDGQLGRAIIAKVAAKVAAERATR